MPSKRDNRDYPLVILAIIAAKTLIFTILWVPAYTFRCVLVYFVAKCKPNYGKILDHCDSMFEEPYSEEHPKNSLIFTLVLDAPLELSELRRLFVRNVLEAKIPNKKEGKEELRYREFKQYQSDLAGYKFWKDDPSFNISNHITEVPYFENFNRVSEIHTEMTNKLYAKKRSPWEMILVNNCKNIGNIGNKSLLVYRSHHSLGDTKSILKVLVENLGEKQLSMPNVQYKKCTMLDTLLYYALVPFYFVYSPFYSYYIGLQGDSCPLKYKREDETLVNVGISKPISMNDIKMIAKKNNVNTSTVIMAAVAGGMTKSDARFATTGIPCQWMLPKPGHPDILANHNYAGTMQLPTDLGSPSERLRKCQEIFMHLRSSNLWKYNKSILFQEGTWFNPLRWQLLKNTIFPLVVTNIAGEGEGFSIGSSPVSEFTMTCGPQPGVCSAMVSGFSYRDVIEITATVKDGTLNEGQTQKLADLMAEEFEVLKNM